MHFKESQVLWCFFNYLIPEAPSRKFSHNCVITATWLAITVRCYQLYDTSSFQKCKNMKICASWNSWKIAASTLIKKLGKTQKQSWTWTSTVEEVFLKEVSSSLRHEGWAGGCEESRKEGSRQKSISMTFSLSLNLGVLGLDYNICMYFSTLFCFSSNFLTEILSESQIHT